MTDRNRAWRRRQGRLTMWRTEEKQRALAHELPAPGMKAVPAAKQHQHGKLTHVQDLRLVYDLGCQLNEEFESA